MSPFALSQRLYRVWITRYAGWTPKRWSDVPPRAEAVAPADRRYFPNDGAQRLIEGFNRHMLEEGGRYWAVAVPVRLRVDGEPQRGEVIRSPARPKGAAAAAWSPRSHHGLFQSPQRSK